MVTSMLLSVSLQAMLLSVKKKLSQPEYCGTQYFNLSAMNSPQALHQLNAEHLAGRILSTLSTGERQRVLCAAILSLGQPVLMLDEPLAYLDKNAQRGLLDILRRLAKTGSSVIMFEHRRDIAHRVSDREIFMREGSLCPAEPPHTLFASVPDAPCGGDVQCAVENLSFSFDTRSLFSGVTFEVRSGESTLLLGDNGAGKTTLLSLIMGLIQPDCGTIHINGIPSHRHGPRMIARKAAYLFQQPDHQLFCARVRDELELQTADTAAIERELDTLDLRELADRHPRSLSMGQKRRVTIAAALVRNPALLLLDEPSVGQDDNSLALVIHRLNHYVAEGGALLCATHDARVARALGFKTIIIEKGTARSGGRQLVEEYFGTTIMHEEEK